MISTFIAFTIGIITIAILGNLFLIFVIIRGNTITKMKISPVQLLLLHTAVVDISFATFSLGTELFIMFHRPNLPGPNWLCPVLKFIEIIPLYLSPLLLVAIAYDRYMAICKPMANFRSNKYQRPNKMAIMSWIIAIILSLPQLHVWEISNQGCLTRRYFKKQFMQIYVLYFNLFVWLIPSILATYFYFHVCKSVWLSKKVVLNNTNGITKSPLKSGKRTTFSDIYKDEENETLVYVKRIRSTSNVIRQQDNEFGRKRIHTVRLTLTIIACNFFLWTPYCLFNVVQAIAPDLVSHYKGIANYLGVLGNLNSCVNPWIFILFNPKNVKNALISICPWYLYKKRKAVLVKGEINYCDEIRISNSAF
uniref:G_PROTEIN_RECEP_F1_2 domain-containing protein n=1 Tax=Strongyloides stercoralis TaxID=6248 RepID=A0A0K0E713_STRER